MREPAVGNRKSMLCEKWGQPRDLLPRDHTAKMARWLSPAVVTWQLLPGFALRERSYTKWRFYM